MTRQNTGKIYCLKTLLIKMVKLLKRNIMSMGVWWQVQPELVLSKRAKVKCAYLTVTVIV